MGTFLFLLFLCLLFIVLRPFIRGYFALRKARDAMNDAMRRATEESRQTSRTGQRHPSYNKSAAEDARYEEITGSAATETAEPAEPRESYREEPLIEDAKFEEV